MFAIIIPIDKDIVIVLCNRFKSTIFSHLLRLQTYEFLPIPPENSYFHPGSPCIAYGGTPILTYRA